MGPLDLVYSWQTVVIAVLVYMTTQLIKVALDMWLSKSYGSLKVKTRLGKEMRQEKPILNRLVMPAIPVWVGVFLACVLPIRPDAIIDYTVAHTTGFNTYLVYSGWGAVVGQFSGWIYTHVYDFVNQVRPTRNPNAD